MWSAHRQLSGVGVPAVQPQLHIFVICLLAWVSSSKPAWQELAPLGKGLASCSEYLQVT